VGEGRCGRDPHDDRAAAPPGAERDGDLPVKEADAYRVLVKADGRAAWDDTG
jgi:hypothetical protein